MLKIGHRGAPAYEPENTLASFAKALELGCDAIELDVHLSSDGELVVIHDETIDRTTNGTGEVEKRSLKELKLLNAGNGEKIPTLPEVFALVNCEAKIFVEIKDESSVEQVASFVLEQIEEHGWSYDDIFVISFHHHALKKIREINEYIRIGATLDDDANIDDLKLIIDDLFPDTVNPSINVLSAEIVNLAHEKGIQVFTWTLKTKEQIEKAGSLKVDGMMFDDPGLI